MTTVDFPQKSSHSSITQNQWWHVSTYGEYGEPSISLRKRQELSVEPKICDSCGHKDDVWTVCVTPEPLV